jgi:L-threonylcarbamoyladenylate synthase
VLLKVNPKDPEQEVIDKAAQVIRRGGLVAFPTETVYGLGADALNPEAVGRIFAAKERPSYDPIIVHIARTGDLALIARDLPPQVDILRRQFWPGPLTLILPRAAALSDRVTAGLDTVAVRMPDHAVALALIRAAETPIAAPSANLFSHVSPTTAQHVLDDLGDRVDVILDGGPTRIGVESTVLDLSGEKPTILRPGGTSRERLQAVLGEVALARRPGDKDQGADRAGQRAGLPSPGLTERHYSPRADLILFQGPAPQVRAAMKARLAALLREKPRVGLLLSSEDRAAFDGYPVLIEDLGSRKNAEQIATRLYAALRALDARGAQVILARGFGATGLELAIADRLIKAAGGQVVKVH